MICHLGLPETARHGAVVVLGTSLQIGMQPRRKSGFRAGCNAARDLDQTAGL